MSPIANSARRARAVASILESPQDGDRVEYWWAQRDAVMPRVAHYRLTYYEDLSWADHARNHNLGLKTSGADFVKEWSVEEEVSPGRWQVNGRADTDWLRRRLADEDVYVYPRQARAKLREHLRGRLGYLQEEVARTEEQLASL